MSEKSTKRSPTHSTTRDGDVGAPALRDIQDLMGTPASASALREPTPAEQTLLHTYADQPPGPEGDAFAELIRPALWAATPQSGVPSRAVVHGLYLTGLVPRPQLYLQIYIQHGANAPHALDAAELWAQGLEPAAISNLLRLDLPDVLSGIHLLHEVADRVHRMTAHPGESDASDTVLVRAAWAGGLLSHAGSEKLRSRLHTAGPPPGGGAVTVRPAHRAVSPVPFLPQTNRRPAARPPVVPGHITWAVESLHCPPDIGFPLHNARVVRVQGISLIWRGQTGTGRSIAIKTGWSLPGHEWTARAPAYEAFVLQHLGVDAWSGHTDAGTWCARDWHDGQDLITAVRTRPREAAAAAARALAALHERGWTHGDVTPEHLLLDQHGTAHLIDLAFAQAQRDAHVPDALSFPYPGADVRFEAPEMSEAIINGCAPAPTPATDTYGWGASVYRAILGHPRTDAPPPFTAQSYTEFRRANVAGHRHPGRVPGFLGTLVEAALATDPAARPELRDIADRLNPTTIPR
ncbi:lipopolysaccharide kinase InaA family protein [Streptomyces sp. NBC_00838]|uniref:lipopolysaccharide kinase InaA family protein n=1 Tax=Streptomyces sp. NBC_00838 TaxID=2903680 RepID=UPI003864AC2C|nr:lipopolysaccharide kinase InaA family protein [Streptomyces sp. NBC_00838]